MKRYVQFSLCMLWSYIVGIEVQLHTVFNSNVVGDESSASRLGRFNSEEKDLRVPLNEGCIGPRAGLGASGERKNPSLLPSVEIHSSIVRQ
jgi:hypothetical protein